MAKMKQASTNGAAKANGSAKPAAKKRPAKQVSDDGDESSSSPSESDESSQDKGKKRGSKSPRKPAAKRTRRSGNESEGPKSSKNGQIMWTTLKHNGVIFPPDYKAHGVKMLYDGKAVDLTPEQEEVASMYAIMLETDYMKKDRFNKNFWEGFQAVLGEDHTIQCLEKCDFRPIYNHLMQEREEKKALPKEEKERLKKEKEAAEAKYKIAYVDGRPEPVGNFRVEPPGLFRGRGEHPKMGCIKTRVYPKDITINIGKGEPIPEHNYPGQTWKEIRHDQTVTWLAYWKDTVSSKDYKYVFLGANSTFKADSDQAKYEKARKLKDLIVDVRKKYQRDLKSDNVKTRQMAVALYFIDILALRAGHEKDEDEADTVGCCTLKVGNVECIPPNQIKFDFLGKDSIKYENTVEVVPNVYAAVQDFRKTAAGGAKKKDSDLLFDTMKAQDVNQELKNIMDGLTVKVFRTYNASITLQRLLDEMEARVHKQGDVLNVDQKKVEYDRANKEVAVLCNHQRAVPKTHGDQVAKLSGKMEALQEELKQLKAELKKNKGDASLERKVEAKEKQIDKLELQMQNKEELKTVALGTSKINYMDPRITVAWCKRNEVPIEKIFNKSLLAKFNWCMDEKPDFKF